MLNIVVLLSILSFSIYSKELTILHTNDLHSRFLGGTDYQEDSEFKKLGHFAKLSHIIKKTKKGLKDTPYVLVDGGDFYSGSLFHILGPRLKSSYNPELDFFLYNEYDASTLGNHEFDASEDGLANMLNKLAKKETNFKIVSSNVVISKKSKLNKFKNSLIVKSHTKTLAGNIKVGFLGLLGPDGSRVSRNGRSNVTFVGYDEEKDKVRWDSLIESLQKTVDKLQNNNVDFIIALMHGGSPEDIKIAKEVNGIDLIVAGHTHTVYKKPIRVSNTFIVQAGSYGQFLGKVTLSKANGQLTILNNDFIKNVDPSTPKDETYNKLIAKYQLEINQHLKMKGTKSSDYIFTSNDSYTHRGEGSVLYGIKVISAVRNQLNKKLKNPIDFYFSSRSLVREGLLNGKQYNLSEIFQILPIGMDKDYNPGSPVVSLYLTNFEVRKIISFLELYSKFNPIFTPIFSDNIKYEVRSWGIPFVNRIKNLTMNGIPFENWPNLIRVGTNSYVGGYLDKVGSMSFGLIKFTAKDKKGRPVKIIKSGLGREFLLLSDELKTKGKL